MTAVQPVPTAYVSLIVDSVIVPVVDNVGFPPIAALYIPTMKIPVNDSVKTRPDDPATCAVSVVHYRFPELLTPYVDTFPLNVKVLVVID